MDQSFSAGVGNWVADEILHLARVHPAAPAGMLADAQVEAVWKSMKDVVNIAVEANADHSKFPKRASCSSGLAGHAANHGACRRLVVQLAME